MIDVFDGILAARLCGGGGGGTSDYRQLSNLPSINGTILIGNKTLADLGIEWVWRGTRSEYEATKATIPPNTFVDITDEPDMDTVPTQGSLNPVTSNGLWMELSKLKVINENPENHNGIYRGKDLTNIYTIEQIYERVHDGSFEDLYLGDYFTVHLTTDLYTRFTDSAFVEGTTYYEMGGTVIARTWTETQDTEPQEGKVYATKQVVEEDVDYMIAGFDMYRHIGEYHDFIADHNIILIPRAVGYKTTGKMHNNNSDLTGYAGSDMNNITLPCYAESTKTALNGHLIQMPLRLSSAVDPSVVSMSGGGYNGGTTAYTAQKTYAALMNDIQFFGTAILLSSYNDVGIDFEKFPIFNFIPPIDSTDPSDFGIMLRSISRVVNNSVHYAFVIQGGRLAAVQANQQGLSVRPYFLFG